MNFGELIPLVGALVNFSLAIFVFLQNPRTAVARVYLVLGLSFAVWNFGTAQLFRLDSTQYESAFFWGKFLQSGVIFIPLALCHLSCLVAQIPVKRWLVITLYGLHGLLLFTSISTNSFISSVDHLGYAWYSRGGPWFWIFICLVSLGWTSVVVLALHRRRLPPLAQRRVTPLLWAHASFSFFGCNDVLPILRYDHYPFTGGQIYPIGSMLAIGYGMLVGYGVLQHQLLEVRVVLNRHIAKVVRMLFLFSTGLCTMLIFWLFDREAFQTIHFIAASTALMAGALCASLFFPRIFGQDTESVERRILGDSFEYQDQVMKFIEGMPWYNNIDILLDDLHDLLTRVLRLESYEIVLRDETLRIFDVSRSHPARPRKPFSEIKSHSPILEYFARTKREYLARDNEPAYGRYREIEADACHQLANLQASLCFPLSSDGEPLGLLFIGEKRDASLTPTDINLLINLVRSLGLITTQIRLKTQVMQAQELDLLGRMSRGMAHDLNNLLTPVWTLLQLAGEAESHAINEDLLPVALRNVKTMRAYIREALFFSEHLRPDIQPARLDLLLEHAAEMAATSRLKDVEITTKTPGEVIAEVDEVLIERLVANIISNAIDASPDGAKVCVELIQLIKGESKQDWLRIRISDEGDGIAKDDMERVFTPYFTTKNRGDEARGFGLGLAICRKIVNLHGGNLSIASQFKKGTTMQVDLPRTQAYTLPNVVAMPA